MLSSDNTRLRDLPMFQELASLSNLQAGCSGSFFDSGSSETGSPAKSEASALSPNPSTSLDYKRASAYGTGNIPQGNNSLHIILIFSGSPSALFDRYLCDLGICPRCLCLQCSQGRALFTMDACCCTWTNGASRVQDLWRMGVSSLGIGVSL